MWELAQVEEGSRDTTTAAFFFQLLELGLLQTHMAQKPVLRVVVGPRALRVRSVSSEEAWASAGMQDAWLSGCGCEAD